MEAVKTCAALLVPSLLPPSIFTTPFVQFSQASAQVLWVLCVCVCVCVCVYITVYVCECVSECVCAIQVVGDVLSKMLVVGITDPGIYNTIKNNFFSIT